MHRDFAMIQKDKKKVLPTMEGFVVLCHLVAGKSAIFSASRTGPGSEADGKQELCQHLEQRIANMSLMNQMGADLMNTLVFRYFSAGKLMQ